MRIFIYMLTQLNHENNSFNNDINLMKYEFRKRAKFGVYEVFRVATSLGK